MLSTLHIRDMVLIERLELNFGAGLNVLTGETGAGKSILLDCLGLALGWRTRADMAAGAKSTSEVEARFEIGGKPQAREILDDAGIPAGDEVILRRAISANGRKRGWVNDRSVSAEFMREIGDLLVEMHGQHDDKGLLDERNHIALLDRFGGVDTAPMASAYSAMREARREYERAKAASEAAKSDAEYILHASAELAEFDAKEGEEAELDARRRLLKKSASHAGEFERLRASLGSDGLGREFGEALRLLGKLDEALEGNLSEARAHLEAAFDRLGDAEGEVARRADELAFDPGELEAIEERLFALRALGRKYQIAPDDLPRATSDFAARALGLEEGEGQLEEFARKYEEARQLAERAASELSRKRGSAADALDQAISKELPPLKLEKARFITEIEAGELSAHGLERVRFLVKTHMGAGAGPISKIASGGELSRFLLAIKISLERDEGASLIFDEIDRGVGGKTADAVGRRLQKLARGNQVLVVTHSPQVAAMADHHFRVEKTDKAGAARTHIEPLGQVARLHELARMLSGDHVSEEALAAAEVLARGARESHA